MPMFKKKVRHINRYREIAAALFSQGFDYIVEEIGLLQKIPYYQRVRPVISAGGTGGVSERIRLVLQQLGPIGLSIAGQYSRLWESASGLLCFCLAGSCMPLSAQASCSRFAKEARPIRVL